MTVGLEHIPGTHEIGAKSITHSPATMAPTQDSGTRSGKAEVENITTLYFEPGLMANDYIGIYGKFGVTGMTVNSIETTKTATYGNKTLMGGMYGVGIKLVTPYGIFFKLEGTMTEYPTITLKSNVGNKNIIKADTEQESVRLAIGYNF